MNSSRGAYGMMHVINMSGHFTTAGFVAGTALIVGAYVALRVHGKATKQDAIWRVAGFLFAFLGFILIFGDFVYSLAFKRGSFVPMPVGLDIVDLAIGLSQVVMGAVLYAYLKKNGSRPIWRKLAIFQMVCGFFVAFGEFFFRLGSR